MNLKTSRRINRIIVHCSANKMGSPLDAADIDRIHRARGWSGIGYHFVITADGALEAGRDINKAGAHAKNYNRGSIGICLIGGLDDNMKPSSGFGEYQYRTLSTLIDELQDIYPDAEILGHRDLPGVTKACPCFDVKSWLKTNKPREPEKKKSALECMRQCLKRG